MKIYDNVITPTKTPKDRDSNKIRQFLKHLKFPPTLQNRKCLGEGECFAFGDLGGLGTEIYTVITQVGKGFNTIKTRNESKSDIKWFWICYIFQYFMQVFIRCDILHSS